MRIVFVDNLLLERENGITKFVLQPHLGLISLIAVAESAGHEGLLYDPKLALARNEVALDASLYHAIAQAILRLNPDVVGLTTLGCNFICTVKVARYLKAAAPDLPILLGGPHATVLDRAIMAGFPQFDVIVRNEAELKLLPVLAALPNRNFEGVPGITFRRGDRVIATPGEPVIDDLDSLPYGAYHKYPIQELGLQSLRVDAGRGCPFSCTFCSTASFFGRKYRLKSAQRLVEELDFLQAQYGITDFGLTHDLFTVNRAKVVAFCHAVAERGYTWKCSARMDCVDPELLELMQHAGCRSIYYGVEAGSRRMQKVVDKHLDLDLFAPILAATYRVGMNATVSFITGYPQEEQPDQDATLDMIGSCFLTCKEPLNVQLHLLTPEPGTKLLQDFQLALRYDGHITDFNFPTLEADDASVMEQYPSIFMNHHYFESVLPRQQHVLVTSAYQVLYKLGFTVLAHLLSYYDDKLSGLFSRMVAWAQENGREAPFDDTFVRAFMAGEWGEGHYLTSLVRYMLTAAEMANDENKHALPARLVSCEPSGTACSKPCYKLVPTVALVRNIHDCPAILERLTAQGPSARATVSTDLGGPRSDYLLMLDLAQEGIIRNFALDETAADLVAFFRQEHAYQEYADCLQAGHTASQASHALFMALVQMGALGEVQCDGSCV